LDVKEKAKNLPASPGVYLMLDSNRTIIYVGKSKALKNRVSSYFQNSKAHSPKVIKMVKNLKDFEYIVTDTEFEALLLECKLIREIKPAYNRLMKNTKAYCYIKINIMDKYPDIETCKKNDKTDGNIYFGPYTSSNTVNRAIDGIKENCKILCSSNLSKKPSACLNYYLKNCIGMCTADNLTDQYSAIITRIIALLKGEDNSILEEIIIKMNNASEKFDFENATKYRDYISAIKYVLNSAKSVKFSKENENIAVIEPITGNFIKFILLKGNNIIFRNKYDLNNASLEDLKDELKKEILFNFNNNREKTEIGIDEIDEMNIIFSYLKNEINNCKYEIISNETLNNETALYVSLEKLILDINKK
jgi:excinuclease ABC subunit C